MKLSRSITQLVAVALILFCQSQPTFAFEKDSVKLRCYESYVIEGSISGRPLAKKTYEFVEGDFEPTIYALFSVNIDSAVFDNGSLVFPVKDSAVSLHYLAVREQDLGFISDKNVFILSNFYSMDYAFVSRIFPSQSEFQYERCDWPHNNLISTYGYAYWYYFVQKVMNIVKIKQSCHMRHFFERNSKVKRQDYFECWIKCNL